MTRLAFIVAVLGSLTAMPTHAASPQWTLAAESAVTHKATVATFTDEKNGMTAGYAGAMYVTHDGGKTWSPAANSSACRFGLEAVPGAAFTAGNQGHVRVSTDGGEHWSSAASFGRTEPVHARHLSFADARRGLIATPEEVALTVDGATTWTKLTLPGDVGIVAAVSATEEGGALRLRVLDEQGALFASVDGGKSWSKARSPLTSPIFESMTAPWAALRFRGAEGVLFAFVDDGGLKPRAFRTHDGGKTWAADGLPATVPPGAPSFSADGKLLVTCDARSVRVYRVN